MGYGVHGLASANGDYDKVRTYPIFSKGGIAPSLNYDDHKGRLRPSLVLGISRDRSSGGCLNDSERAEVGRKRCDGGAVDPVEYARSMVSIGFDRSRACCSRLDRRFKSCRPEFV